MLCESYFSTFNCYFTVSVTGGLSDQHKQKPLVAGEELAASLESFMTLCVEYARESKVLAFETLSDSNRGRAIQGIYKTWFNGVFLQ